MTRDSQARAPSGRQTTDGAGPAAVKSFWRRPFSVVAAAITVLVGLSAFGQLTPVRNAGTLEPLTEGHLVRSGGYLAIDPLSEVLDTLTLLTPAQHVAIILTLVLLFVIVRVVKSGRSAEGGFRALRELRATAWFVVGLLVLYGAMAALPRPMARLQTNASDLFSVEFHTHTRHSHDGRWGWTSEDVRAWAKGAGFNAVYISDHRTTEGAAEGEQFNPFNAGGDRPVVLSAIEVGFHGEHVNLLDAGTRYRGLTTPDSSDIDDQRLAIAAHFLGVEPVLIETMPGHLANAIPARGPGTSGVRGVEIVDGSPRGLAQTRRDRDQIVAYADSLNLALVSGSDNHGWGRAAPGWTVLSYPTWGALSPDSLSAAIEAILRLERRQGTAVGERVIAPGVSAPEVVFSGVLVPWTMLRTLSWAERAVWLAWFWVVALLVWWRAERRRPRRNARAKRSRSEHRSS